MKITTREELIAYIALHKEVCTDIPLFEGNDYNGNKWVRDVSIPAKSDIIIGSPIHGSGENSHEFLFVNGDIKGSLIDRNIPENSYNNHWWFTTREEAEAHIRPKSFEVGRYYEWSESASRLYGQGGPFECVFTVESQGAFLKGDDNLIIIDVAHLHSGVLKLRQ